jgi:hypothetical protein
MLIVTGVPTVKTGLFELLSVERDAEIVVCPVVVPAVAKPLVPAALLICAIEVLLEPQVTDEVMSWIVPSE